MDSPPRFRDFVRGVWSLWSRSAERELKRMAGVRRPLLRVVHSQLTDDEATDRIRLDVQGDPAAARATLAYVHRAHGYGPGYITDRACRILQAAMSGTEPAPISPQRRDLYERERQLGWLPLEAAFEQIAQAAPEARNIVVELARPDVKGSQSLELTARLQKVVGPDAQNPDPLVRTTLANPHGAVRPAPPGVGGAESSG